MSKKKLKKMLRKATKNSYGSDWSNSGYGGDLASEDGFKGGFGYGNNKGFSSNLLGNLGLPRGMMSGQTEQFIIGALLGAAAAYVLADEELRNKIMKSVVKLYSGFAGGVEEFKEQMADLKAEIEAQHGA